MRALRQHANDRDDSAMIEIATSIGRQRDRAGVAWSKQACILWRRRAFGANTVRTLHESLHGGRPRPRRRNARRIASNFDEEIPTPMTEAGLRRLELSRRLRRVFVKHILVRCVNAGPAFSLLIAPLLNLGSLKCPLTVSCFRVRWMHFAIDIGDRVRSFHRRVRFGIGLRPYAYAKSLGTFLAGQSAFRPARAEALSSRRDKDDCRADEQSAVPELPEESEPTHNRLGSFEESERRLAAGQC